MCSPHEDYGARPGGAGTAAGQLGRTRTRALCEPRGATGDGERLPAPPAIPTASGPFSYSCLGGAVVASWPVCLTRTPSSQICAFPAGGPDTSTASSPSEPFPIPLCPRIPHGPNPASPCYTDPTSAEASEPSPERDISTQGAPRAPEPSLWTPLSVLASPGSSCCACCLSRRAGAGRTEPNPTFPVQWAF